MYQYIKYLEESSLKIFKNLFEVMESEDFKNTSNFSIKVK